MDTRAMKRGLVLDKVVLLGRTLDEYRRYFALDLEQWRGKSILDVASGVGSFGAEARQAGVSVTACDPIYALHADDIEQRCGPDLDHILEAVRNLETYRWNFYRSPEYLRTFRERAYRTFLQDFRARPQHYVPGSLPRLPFPDTQFDLTLVSYFLFVYEDQFDYEFHRKSLLELMRVTRGEVRIYPTVTFEAHRSTFLDRLRADPSLRTFDFEIVATDFEFLVGSNNFLRVFRR
jgi:SAM-dependent methyltransferase